MSMLVRRPARHSLFLETEPVDFSEYERHDIDHVRNKYPKAQDTIIKRLGLAITRRRKTLRYRERHHAKLGRGLDTGNDTMSVLSDTIATTLSIQEIGLEEGSSRTDFSQTSFAPSLSSGGNPTVPNPPKDTIGGATFECPYCFYVISIPDSHSWIKHVFLDLCPYICTALDYSTPHKPYLTRHEWEYHLKSAHEKIWLGTEYTPTTGVGGHKLSTSATCPLCTSEFKFRKQLESDLARHLQELALFALPRSEPDYDGGNSDGTPETVAGDRYPSSVDSDRSQNIQPDEKTDDPHNKLSVGTASGEAMHQWQHIEPQTTPSYDGDGWVEDDDDGDEYGGYKKPAPEAVLHDFFLPGKGIHREVLHKEICK